MLQLNDGIIMLGDLLSNQPILIIWYNKCVLFVHYMIATDIVQEPKASLLHGICKKQCYCKWKDKFKETLGNCKDASSDSSADNVVSYNKNILPWDHFFVSKKGNC